MKIGIYGFQNKLHPEKWYVGQSTNIEARWNEYRLLRCKTQRKWFNALKKYGYDGFSPAILEECETAKLPTREEFWVKEKNSVVVGYNCKTGGFNGGRHSDETKRLISEKLKGRKMSEEQRALRRRYRATDETKKKISASLIGNQRAKGLVHSDEHKAIISARFKGVPKTEQHKAKIRAKSYWAGKVSPEARKRAGDKLRGRSRPDEVKNKISATKTGTKRKYLPNGSFIMVKPN